MQTKEFPALDIQIEQGTNKNLDDLIKKLLKIDPKQRLELGIK